MVELWNALHVQCVTTLGGNGRNLLVSGVSFKFRRRICPSD